MEIAPIVWLVQYTAGSAVRLSTPTNGRTLGKVGWTCVSLTLWGLLSPFGQAKSAPDRSAKGANWACEGIPFCCTLTCTKQAKRKINKFISALPSCSKLERSVGKFGTCSWCCWSLQLKLAIEACSFELPIESLPVYASLWHRLCRARLRHKASGRRLVVWDYPRASHRTRYTRYTGERFNKTLFY